MTKTTSLPLKLLIIEGDGFHIMLHAKINGKKAAMLIDTGASKTVFDLNRITKFVGEKSFEKNSLPAASRYNKML